MAVIPKHLKNTACYFGTGMTEERDLIFNELWNTSLAAAQTARDPTSAITALIFCVIQVAGETSVAVCAARDDSAERSS